MGAGGAEDLDARIAAVGHIDVAVGTDRGDILRVGELSVSDTVASEA